VVHATWMEQVGLRSTALTEDAVAVRQADESSSLPLLALLLDVRCTLFKKQYTNISADKQTVILIKSYG